MTCIVNSLFIPHFVFDPPSTEFHSFGNILPCIFLPRIERQRALLSQVQHRRISCTNEGHAMLQGYEVANNVHERYLPRVDSHASRSCACIFLRSEQLDHLAENIQKSNQPGGRRSAD